jgi:uncharacterized protein (DUF488 family)
MAIFTVGYQALHPAELAAIVRTLHAMLIDVRSSARSSIPGFGGPQLASLLGDRYQHRPALGGRIKIAPAAIERLRREYEGQERPNAVLMCMEENPVDCHRHHAICSGNFPEALHIFRNGLFTANAIDDYVRTGRPPIESGVVQLEGDEQ